MPKPTQPPCGQRISNLPGAIMVLGAIGAVIVLGGSLALFMSDRTLPEAEFIDLTGQIRYGKDKSTGICFANIRTADSDPRLWRTLAYISCRDLEGIKW